MMRVTLLLACCMLLCPHPASTAHAGTPATRYVLNTSAGTFTDTVSGLVWRLATESAPTTWAAADQACRNWGGRLPSLKDLLTLVDPAHFNPAIHPSLSSYTPTASYWSSTPKANGNNERWYVSFKTGRSGWNPVARDTTYPDSEPCCYARCVR